MVVLDDVDAPVLAEAAKGRGVLVCRRWPRPASAWSRTSTSNEAGIDRAAAVLTELLDR